MGDEDHGSAVQEQGLLLPDDSSSTPNTHMAVPKCLTSVLEDLTSLHTEAVTDLHELQVKIYEALPLHLSVGKKHAKACS